MIKPPAGVRSEQAFAKPCFSFPDVVLRNFQFELPLWPSSILLPSCRFNPKTAHYATENPSAFWKAWVYNPLRITEKIQINEILTWEGDRRFPAGARRVSQTPPFAPTFHGLGNGTLGGSLQYFLPSETISIG